MAVIAELDARGLWPKTESPHMPRAPWPHAITNDPLGERNKPSKGETRRRLREVCQYDYFDHLTGELCMQVIRYDPKTFKQRRPDTARPGGWIWSVDDEHRTLYNALRAFKHDKTIFVVEGEKDVDNLAKIDAVAVCNPGGAGNWQDHYSEILRDKDVIIVPDNDEAGEKHASLVANSLNGRAKSIRVLRLPGLRLKGDISDWIDSGGDRMALSDLAMAAPIWEPAQQSATLAKRNNGAFLATDFYPPEVRIGSEVEIAHLLRKILADRLGKFIHAEGRFWHYIGTHWEPIAEDSLRRAVHRFDGAPVEAERTGMVKLNTGKINSILREMEARCVDAKFFEAPVQGINCASGFIHFNAIGQPDLSPHDRAHRCRHTLPGAWSVGSAGNLPESSLLRQLLDGSFMGDPDASEKAALLAEIAGVTALGLAASMREPKAVVLYGMTAENGKSQILDMIRGLLPASAVCSITAAKMGDERHIVGLSGKLLNATDELSGEAIASDTFKAIITGEPVEGRDVYKSRVEFRPRAQHVFATNVLPPYKGGMDRGVRRRLLVIPFNRTVPIRERIEHIGQRIGVEEADLLLAWAVAGASRVIRQRCYSEPASSKSALLEWLYKADAIQAWIEDCVTPCEGNWVPTSVAYEQFCYWAVAEGHRRERLPLVNTFSDRVILGIAGATTRRTSKKRGIAGIMISGPL